MMTVNVRKYVEGQMYGDLPPLRFVPRPWADKPNSPPEKRTTKYNLEALDVGETRLVPVEQGEEMWAFEDRISRHLTNWHSEKPQRFFVRFLTGGAKITRQE